VPDNSPEHFKKFYFVDTVTTHINPYPLKTPMIVTSANKPLWEHRNSSTRPAVMATAFLWRPG